MGVVEPVSDQQLDAVKDIVYRMAKLQGELDAIGVGRQVGTHTEQLLKSWQIVGWPMRGDEDGDVAIRCPRCYQRDMDVVWTPVTAPKDKYPTLADAIITAVEHVCPTFMASEITSE